MRAILMFILLFGAERFPAQSTTPGRYGGGSGFGQRMDANGDGLISRDEFPGPKDFFDQFDANKDGFLSVAERETMRRARQTQGGRRAGADQGVQGLFRALDVNADQKISAKEWAVLLQAREFKAADTEADGQVTAAEWQRFFQQRERPARGNGGVKVGAPAPNVTAKRLKGEGAVDFSKIKRHTVVVFGSYT